MKASHSAIVTTLDSVYEQTHEPEALGISKALCKSSKICAIFLLDYALVQTAKLSRSLQAEKIDFTAIGHFVDATLSTLDDAVLPAANWVLELLDVKDDLQAATGTTISVGYYFLHGQSGQTLYHQIEEQQY